MSWTLKVSEPTNDPSDVWRDFVKLSVKTGPGDRGLAVAVRHSDVASLVWGLREMAAALEKGTAFEEGATATAIPPETSITELYFSTATENKLRNLGIETAHDLTQWTEPGLLRGPNFGRKTLNEVKEVMAVCGLSFRTA